MIAYQQAAVAFAVGTQHETVVGDVRSGIVTGAEVAERVNDKRVFVEIVHAGNFRTENVCACFCAELIVVVNHHRFRTCGIGAVYDNAFCCRLDSLLRNGNLLVEHHNVSDLGKICRIYAADRQYKAAYGDVSFAVADGVDSRNYVVARFICLAYVLDDITRTTGCRVGVICRVHHFVRRIHIVVADFRHVEVSCGSLFVVICRVCAEIVIRFAVNRHRYARQAQISCVLAFGKGVKSRCYRQNCRQHKHKRQQRK